jgi:hypothetical protein
MLIQITVAFLSVSVAVAASISGRSLPSDTVTCGNNQYEVSDIEAAINAGVDDMNAGNLPGVYHQLDGSLSAVTNDVVSS